MLIEQIFYLRGPEPPGRICTPITGCFHSKIVASKKNNRLDFCLLLKYCRRQYTLLPPPGPNYLQNLTLKSKILNVFWLKLRTKGGLNYLIFSSGF